MGKGMAVRLFAELRPLNGFIAAAGVFAGFVAAAKAFIFPQGLILAVASAFLITSAGNLVNDFFDMEIDKKLGRKNPLVSGSIGKEFFLAFTAALFIAGLWLAWLVNETAFIIALAVSILLVVYSALMQRQKALGNFVVAFGTSLTLVFGAAIAGEYVLPSLFAASAFFANVGREIIKDSEQLGADRGVKKSLPMILGFDKIRLAVLGVYIVAALVAFAAWVSGGVQSIAFLAFLIVSAALLYVSWSLFSRKKFAEAQRFSKYAMVAALLAFVAVAL